MIKQLRRGLLTVLTGVLVASAGAPLVNAQAGGQSANGFRISPVRSEYVIEKGKSETLTVNIENPTEVAVNAQAVVNDFLPSDDESGTPRLVLDVNGPTPRNSFRSLVGLLDNVQLGPKQKKDITVKISVPSDANAGGYYGAIRFVPINPTPQQSNVGLTASVGTIVLVTVPGDLKQRLDLVQITAAQNGKAKKFFTKGDVSVITRLRNSGDVHLKPFGRVEIKDISGKTVTSFEFNDVEPRANILPDSVRRFENDLNHKKWFGRYTIQANLGYVQGSGDLVLAKTTFWYIPGWALYSLLVLLLIAAVATFLIIRKVQGSKLLPRLRRKKR